jgi:DNA (cytosine-5)-methyltransferase 1
MLKLPRATHGPTSADQKPYTTAWDAIGDLDDDIPELSVQGRWAELLPSIPEGSNYLWRTPGKAGQPLFGWRTKYWSFLLKLSKALPSWTIVDHLSIPWPGGGAISLAQSVIVHAGACRLQTFPDGYRIAGSRRAAQRQIGNAVPSALAEFIGLEIRRQLADQANAPTQPSLVPAYRDSCLGPERVRSVHRSYLGLRGTYKAHLGTGKGPSPQRRLGRSGAGRKLTRRVAGAR